MDKPDYIKLRRTAYEYIVEQGKTQKETATLLAVTEKTISEWAREGGWRELRKTRQSAASTARENIQRLISLLSEKRLNLELEINAAVDAADSDIEIRLRKEANAISADMAWQRKNLEGLDKENKSLGQHVDIFDEIFSALRAYNPELFEQTIDFQTMYLRRKSNELG
jgi:transposase